MVSIDLKDPDFLTGFDSIFIEAMTKQYAMDSDIIGTSEYKTFFREVKAFSLEAHSQVWDNSWQLKPFKNDEKCFLFHLKSSFRSQDI